MARCALHRRSVLPIPLGPVALFRSPTNFYRRMHMLMQRHEPLATSCSRGWRLGTIAACVTVLAIAAGVAGLQPARAQDAPARAVNEEDRTSATRRDADRDAQKLRAQLAETEKALQDAVRRLAELQKESAVQRDQQTQREVALKAHLENLMQDSAKRNDTEALTRQKQMLDQAAASLEATKLDESVARQLLEKIATARTREPATAQAPAAANTPRRDTRPATSAADPARAAGAASAPALSLGAGQLDLIALAVNYVDATGSARTARARLEHAAKLTPNNISAQEIDERKAAAETAQRKAELLRGVIEIALAGAEAEYKDVASLVERGLVSRSKLSDAEAKLQILKLILNSGR
jgi:hypothetical protein